MQTIAKILPFAPAPTAALTPKPAATPASEATPLPWRPTLEAYTPSLAAARDLVARFAEEMRLAGQQSPADYAARRIPGKWLTLTGANGTGKTMLARQLFDYARRFNPGRATVWGDTPRPESHWIDGYKFASRIKNREFDLPDSFEPDWLVVFDELGASRDPTDFIAEALCRFCSTRLGRWTVFTTNLTLEEIATRIDARIASRIIRDGNKPYKITLDVSDYALRNK